MERVRLFQNLVAAAAIDGDIADEERALLAWFARGLGVGETDFVAAIAMATAGTPKLVVPKDARERIASLEMLAKILRADRKVTARERGLYLAYGRRMGVSDAELNARLRAPARPKRSGRRS